MELLHRIPPVKSKFREKIVIISSETKNYIRRAQSARADIMRTYTGVVQWQDLALQKRRWGFDSFRPCHKRFTRLWRATFLYNLSVYYFYILRSLKNKKLYLGFTTDWEKRLKEHNDGKNFATKPNIPYELVYYSAFKNKQDAINCEKYFKTTRGWERIHRMLEHSLK